MDENMTAVRQQKIDGVIEALKRNGMTAYYAPTCESAVERARSLLNRGDTVSCGGSVSLKESGVNDLIRGNDYVFFDRMTNEAGIYEKICGCDAFFTSTNALTEDGELYNVDGNGNRVSALTFGPKRVVVIAGYNKIVKDIEEAVYRVKTVAAPANTKRLKKTTPCAHTGRCSQMAGKMTDGCESEGRICRHYTITGKQSSQRIHVIIVGEVLGY